VYAPKLESPSSMWVYLEGCTLKFGEIGRERLVFSIRVGAIYQRPQACTIGG